MGVFLVKFNLCVRVYDEIKLSTSWNVNKRKIRRRRGPEKRRHSGMYNPN